MPWWAQVTLVVLGGWWLVVYTSPRAVTRRRVMRHLRRKYPMADERDLRRMGGRR